MLQRRGAEGGISADFASTDSSGRSSHRSWELIQHGVSSALAAVPLPNTEDFFLLHLKWNQNSSTSHRLHSAGGSTRGTAGTSQLTSPASSPAFRFHPRTAWNGASHPTPPHPRGAVAAMCPAGTGARGLQVPRTAQPRGRFSETNRSFTFLLQDF